MSKPFLLLDLYVDATAEAHFAAVVPAALKAVRPADTPLPNAAELSQYAGIIVSGSAASIIDEAHWVAPSADLLRSAMAADIPILGVCFGHQLLAYAVGGLDAVEDAPGPEVGYLPIHITEPDPLLDAIGPEFTTFVSHAQQVRPHPAIEVLGHTSACAVHALRVRGKRAWGVQFHTEYPLVEETRIIHYRAQKHPELAFNPTAMLAKRVDTHELSKALFAQFVTIANQ